jgi:hypothetical protein
MNSLEMHGHFPLIDRCDRYSLIDGHVMTISPLASPGSGLSSQIAHSDPSKVHALLEKKDYHFLTVTVAGPLCSVLLNDHGP